MSELAKAMVVPKPVLVTITLNPPTPPGTKPKVSVVPDEVRVHKGLNEEVVWTCPQNLDFTVIMEKGTPFHRSKFTPIVDHSGVPILTPDPGAEVYFKYLVEVEGTVADPGMIVDPLGSPGKKASGAEETLVCASSRHSGRTTLCYISLISAWRRVVTERLPWLPT